MIFEFYTNVILIGQPDWVSSMGGTDIRISYRKTMIENSNSGNTDKRVDFRSKVIASHCPRKDKLDEAPITNKMKSFVVGFKGGIMD